MAINNNLFKVFNLFKGKIKALKNIIAYHTLRSLSYNAGLFSSSDNMMSRFYSPGLLLGATLILLSGCQQPRTQEPVSEHQVNQLAALVSAADWLRDNCQRKDIPARQYLLSTALEGAAQRGWKVDAASRIKLSNDIDARYAAINEDSGLVSEKCTVLNGAVSPFIHQSMAR